MPPLALTSPVRIGIAGLGRMGLYHLQRLSLRDDCRLVTGFDIDTSHAGRAEDHGCQFVNDWATFLAQPDIELVLIATPPDTHARLAIDALAAGKHVAVEQPMCLSVADADEMLEAAWRADGLLGVVNNRRWDDDFQTALATVQSGDLGRIHAIKLEIWEYGFRPGEIATREIGWRADQCRGGGVLVEFGATYFDQLLQLVPDSLESVYARIPRICNPNTKLDAAELESHEGSEAGRAEDAFLAIVNFSTGLTARIEANLASPTPVNSGWTVAGTRGGYRNFRKYRVTAEGEIYGTAVESISTDWDRCYFDIFQHVRLNARAANAVNKDEDDGAESFDSGCGPDQPLTTAAEARRVVQLIEAARQSALTGQVVPISDTTTTGR